MTKLKPDDPDERLAFSMAMAELMERQEPITVELTPMQAWCVMCALQLAWRHPEASKKQTMQIAAEFARAIQARVATDGILADVAQAGWDESQDV